MSGSDAFLEAWFAPPEARAHFDAAALDDAQRSTWEQVRSERRRRDWEVSRALLGAVAPARRGAYSLAHSHGHAAIGVVSHGTVGIDLEACRPRDCVRLAAAAYTPGEAAYVRSDENPLQAFYRVWVLKEAYVKASRVPLADVLQKVDFSVALRGGTDLPGSDAIEWAAWVYAPRTGWMLGLFIAGAGVRTLQPKLTEWPQSASGDWPLVCRLPRTSNDLAAA